MIWTVTLGSVDTYISFHAPVQVLYVSFANTRLNKFAEADLVSSMKFALKLGLPSLALSSAVSRGHRGGHEIDKNDFVHVKGLRLYDSNGLHYLTGQSFPLYLDSRR
jgi:hypothetical protein